MDLATRIDTGLRNALLEVFNENDVDAAIEKCSTGQVRDLRRELDFDSLDEIDFIMALEEQLDVEISDAEAEQLLADDLSIEKFKALLQAQVLGRVV